MNFQLITPSSSEQWEAYYALRWRVLQEPWDQPRNDDADGLEAASDHLAAMDEDGRVIACGRLHLNDPEEAQIRYMAVAPDAQGRGIGRAMVLRLEEIARGRGARRLVLNARETALDFYHRLGYQIIEPGPTVFGVIKHQKMLKTL